MTINRNLSVLAEGANSSGVLGTTKGGTGLSSVGTNGQVIQSNGTSLSWATPATTSPAGSTGQVQYNNAGAFGAISSGTSGQVLTSAGSGSVPTWTTPSAGAMTLIETKTLTNAAAGTVVFSNISSSWKTVVLILHNIIFNASVRAAIRIGTGTGPTIQSSGYNYGGSTINTSGTQNIYNGSNASQFFICDSATGTTNYTGVIYFSNLQAQNSSPVTIQGQYQTGQFNGFNGGQWSSSITPVTAISLVEITTGTATITGTVSLYGIST